MNTTRPRPSSPHHPLVRRIGDLKRERARLEEEVAQLKAAVDVWTAVCRHTMESVEPVSKPLDAEIG